MYKSLTLIHMNFLHEAVELGSHLGGAVGNGCAAINDLGYVVGDIRHHDYIGAGIEVAQTIFRGTEAIADVSSGDWF